MGYQSNPGVALYTVETITGIDPLDGQFADDTAKTIPDKIRDAFFAQPEPREDDVQAFGGEVERVPPLRTYAVLDAARVLNLAELLETSGLEHRCLFKGEAYDELKDVAPWLVALEEGNAFTRHLFTAGTTPWCLWDQAPGIYARSRAPLDLIWRHFRKFTRVKDDQGKWYYFRFWESTYAKPYFVPVLDNQERRQRWFHIDAQHQLSVMLLNPDEGALTICKVDPQDRSDVPNAPFELGPFEREIFAAEKRRQFSERLGAYLAEQDTSFQALSDTQRSDFLTRVISAAYEFDIKVEKAVADFALAYVLLGRSPANDPSLLKALQAPRHQLDRARLVLEETRARMRR